MNLPYEYYRVEVSIKGEKVWEGIYRALSERGAQRQALAEYQEHLESNATYKTERQEKSR